MKIYVNAVPPEGMDMAEKIDPRNLNIETEHVHYADNIFVKAHIEKTKDVLTAKCDIKLKKTQVCSRCLCEFESEVDKQSDFIYKLQGEYIIELDDNIKDAIILDYPIKILCKPDCRGLCHNCGKNLNYGDCDCFKQAKKLEI
jgi:uncharacterized protein